MTKARKYARAELELLCNGVPFSIHNGGAHFVITHNGLTVDFWPGTERWICRTTTADAYTLKRMLQHLKRKR